MKDPCDDNVILRVIARLSDKSAFEHKGKDAVASVVKDDADWAWRILLATERDEKQFYYVIPISSAGWAGKRPDGSFCWAIVQLGPTVWEVLPSVHIPGQLHAYVTIIGVPSPAPWQDKK